MKKLLFMISLLFMFASSGCSLFKNIADRKTGFSNEMAYLEGCIYTEQWDAAAGAFNRCAEKWKKIKPWMQLEIDHDVVNEIDTRFTEVTAYMDTKEKSMSLAGVRVIINIWSDIGSK